MVVGHIQVHELTRPTNIINLQRIPVKVEGMKMSPVCSD